MQLKKNYLNCSIMPAVLTRPKKKVVIEKIFIEKDETTKVSAVQKEEEHRTREERKRKEELEKLGAEL
ncbi:hypothetical protein HMPREF9331_00428 [Capnocytophaga granulosa ATCC 51502]|nr:hypothetical protein HMPREF9331_00428 [Capnocytophaga granulosa ATCC 51502]